MLSGDETRVFRELNRLRPPLRIQLVEQPARMGLHGVLADEELFSDLPVAQPGGDQLEDLELPGRDAELLETNRVDSERIGDSHGDGDLLDDHGLSCLGELEAEPDANDREEQG